MPLPITPHDRRWRLSAALLAVVVLTGPGRADASGQGQSKSDSNSNSGDSSQGSNGSNDSSRTSGDSSNSSRDSSKSSNNSTQNSPKNSSDGSTQWTTDNSSQSHGAHVFSAASAVVLLGASVVGTVMAGKSSSGRDPHPKAVALAAFLRQNHAVLTHDIALAHGPILNAWAREWGLTASEKRHLAVVLEGSAEQGALMTALNGDIDEGRALKFSAAFYRATARALGPVRTQTIVAGARARATLQAGSAGEEASGNPV
jgi:hypothetical protein